jgi:hypothetical protein
MAAADENATWTDLAVGDLAGDGVVDLVTVGDPGVVLHRGRGDGTFQRTFEVPLPLPRAVAVADLTGDGLADVVVAAGVFRQGLVSVFPGLPDGTLGFPFSARAGDWPAALRIADVDADGLLDVVVLDTLALDERRIIVLKNAGAGVLGGSGSWNIPAYHDTTESSAACTLHVADLDLDGFPDVLTGGDVVAVSWNDGAGAFAEVQTLGRGWRCVTAGALDDDDVPDVLTGWKSMDAYLGLGARTWSPAADTNVYQGRFMNDLAILPATVGHARTLLRLDAGKNTMDTQSERYRAVISRFSVLSGLLDGAGSWFVGWLPTRMALADVDGNGTTDVLALSRDGVAVMPSDALGAFPGPLYVDGSATRQLEAVDLNGDGWKDLVRRSRYDVHLLLSRTGGGWDGTWRSAAGEAMPGRPGPFRIADVDRDGAPDLVVSDGGDLYLFRNRGDATFEPPRVLSNSADLSSPPSISTFVVSDLDADGLPEIVRLSSDGATATLDLFTQADGADPWTFGPPRNLGAFALVPDAVPWHLLDAADLSGDGRVDLLLRIQDSPLRILRNQGELAFELQVLDAPWTATLCDAAPADIDQDGRAELFLREGTTTGPVFAVQDVLAAAPVRIPMPSAGGCPDALRDLHGDGRPDWIAHDGVLLAISLRRPDGTFAPVSSHPTRGGSGLALLDWDFDGRTDVVLTHNPSTQDDIFYDFMEIYLARCF